MTDQAKTEKPLLKKIEALLQQLAQLEQALREKEKALEITKTLVEKTNIALEVLLNQRNKVKEDLEEKVLFNVNELVLPHLEKLRNTGLNQAQQTCLEIVEANLLEITTPFTYRLFSKFLNLTPAEILAANLIKKGKTNKEISSLLGLSSKTVEFHRDNIRKKLGIKHKKTNLRSYLQTIQKS